MIITMTGKYRTRNGAAVRLLCIDAPGEQSVLGISKDQIQWWSIAGNYCVVDKESPFDLIEVNPPPPSPLELAARKVCELYFATPAITKHDEAYKNAIAELVAALGPQVRAALMPTGE